MTADDIGRNPATPDVATLGIVGFGIMGERMLRAVLAHPAPPLRISGVWDPSPDAAGRLMAIAPDVPMLPDAASVIAGCDGLYVAAPPAAHLALAQAGFDAGRAVLLEKPLSHDTAAARAFVDRAEAHGERAAVNFPMVSSPAVAQILEWRDAGVIGTPHALDITLGFRRWPRPWQEAASSWLNGRAEGGFAREVASHFLFLTHRVLGVPRLERGRASYPGDGGAEHAVDAELTAAGVPVRLRGDVGGTDRDDTNSWTLRGDAGAVRLRDWSIAEREVDGLWVPAAGAVPNEQQRMRVLAGQLDRTAALIRGDAHGMATLREALRVQEAVEAILSPG